MAVLNWLGARYVINVRRSSTNHGPALVGAGSILQDLNYPWGVVWGSGFITDDLVGLGSAPVEPLCVLALRGPYSWDIARMLGWEAPELFCDPGLLISMMYPVRPKRYEVGFVPHYWHAAAVCNHRFSDDVKLIDVSQTVQTVAEELSACRTVISTSLHGIVAAHAFGIPWVWAKMEPSLIGDGFKFHDFMDGMGIKAEPTHISPEDIGKERLLRLAKNARLPEGASVLRKQRELLQALYDWDVVERLSRVGQQT